MFIFLRNISQELFISHVYYLFLICAFISQRSCSFLSVHINKRILFHLICRPHSTESFTHRKMTLSLADRSTKAQKVKVLPISGRDPDAHRSEMIKVKILNTCHFITCYFFFLRFLLFERYIKGSIALIYFLYTHVVNV